MARHDRRVRRTREALISAFNDLVLSDRKQTIRVSDIVERANVGRSTFYEHYSNADDIYMQALSRPFAVLADAVAGDGGPHELQKLLEHFWENRQRARRVFGDKREQIGRLLAGMIEERLAARNARLSIPRQLAARQLAESALGLMRGWLMSEAPCPTDVLAAAICKTSQAATAALRHRPS